MTKLLMRGTYVPSDAVPLAPDDGNGEAAQASALLFDDVYAAHFDFVYRVAARLSPPHDVDDVVQDAFVVVHRKLSSFEGRAEVTTWLFRIVYLVARGYARKRRLQQFATRALAQLLGPPVSAPSHAEGLIERDRVEALQGALASLSFKKRAALVLFELEAWSCAEIADKLGVPVDTVYTRVYHARRDLAQALQSFDDPRKRR